MARESSKQIGKLREFTVQLAEKLKAAPLAPTEPMRLAILVGTRAFLLPMKSAAEVVPLPAIVPVPWTKAWYRGLTNVRGRLLGVVDLQHLSGRGALPPEQAQQILVLADSHQINAAVLITRAFGLRHVNDLESLGRTGDDRQPWETTTYRDLDGALLTELDLEQLVKSEVFATIGT